MTMKEIEVKALEWRESRMGTSSLVAPHPFGENYVVHQTAEGYRSVGRGFHTLDEAKAAAQSDYETRIRSALVDKPEAVEVGPPELYAARICKGIPADCCDYGVIALAEGVEVCRVWTEENARKIARLLNRHSHAPQSRAAPYPVSAADAGEDKIGPHEQALRDTVEPFLDWLDQREEGAHIKEVREGLIGVEDVIPDDHVVLGAHPRAQKDQGVLTIGHFRRLRDAYDGNATPADTDAAQSGGGSRDALIDQLLKALEAAETYVIDGVTTAKQNLEMNAAYPARKPRYEAELQEARDIYAECQAARCAALAAAKDKP
ncbi:hypothetical protein [Sinorhizobium meliloti]|uniref:hypothetical protein n=1 Tax=Rhizobium meliloti TaxID=382 RepID=UPI0019133371|nr:hypothetical protein [Sinorhizobium meliloti]